MTRYETHSGYTPRVLDDEDAGALQGVCADARERAVVALLLEAGLRLGEIIGLTMGAARAALGDGQLVVRNPKDGRERAVPLGPCLADALRGYLASPDGGRGDDVRALFLGAEGLPLDLRQLDELVQAVAQRAGHPGRVSAHALRATAVARRWREFKQGPMATMEGVKAR